MSFRQFLRDYLDEECKYTLSSKGRKTISRYAYNKSWFFGYGDTFGLGGEILVNNIFDDLIIRGIIRNSVYSKYIPLCILESKTGFGKFRKCMKVSFGDFLFSNAFRGKYLNIELKTLTLDGKGVYLRKSCFYMYKDRIEKYGLNNKRNTNIILFLKYDKIKREYSFNSYLILNHCTLGKIYNKAKNYGKFIYLDDIVYCKRDGLIKKINSVML